MITQKMIPGMGIMNIMLNIYSEYSHFFVKSCIFFVFSIDNMTIWW